MTRSLIVATLDWHYCPEEGTLSIGWDMQHSDADEPIAIGAAPGRRLEDLVPVASLALRALVRHTYGLVPGCQLELPFRE